MPEPAFDTLHAEISVAAGHRVSRYELWLGLLIQGADPDALTRDSISRFLEQGLASFLSEEGVLLEPGPRRRLERALRAIEPGQLSPQQWVSGIAEALEAERQTRREALNAAQSRP